WLGAATEEKVRQDLIRLSKTNAARFVANTPICSIPLRLWEKLIRASGIDPQTRWAALSRNAVNALSRQVTRTELQVSGKSLNKDEFVTCGGVSLKEVNFKTMESRICPGLYFAGELLDIDGITGGFNFQAAWTTGWIAGNSMANQS